MTAGAGSVAAALGIVLDALRPTDSEDVPIADVLGRTLAADVTAGVDLPPWDNAAMDGYACRASDISGASPRSPVRLPVAETVAAGSFPTRDLPPGCAMRIMTGAPVPAGADSVVRVEDTAAEQDWVLVTDARDARRNVRPRGEDVRSGDVVLRAGSRVTASEIAMLAAVGCAVAQVHGRPRVAIIASGDELVPVEEAGALRAGRRIVSANSYSLAAIIADAGGEPCDLGIIADDLAAMLAALERVREFDLLVTSGGISVGGSDYTRVAITEAGGDLRFWRLPIRPGYNSAFGVVHGTPWLGIPGNPVSALVAGEVLLRPAVRRLSGSHSPLRAARRVVAADRIAGSDTATLYLRATIETSDEGPPLARLAGRQGSAILSSSVRADALLIVPPGSGVDPGQQLDALILRDEAKL